MSAVKLFVAVLALSLLWTGQAAKDDKKKDDKEKKEAADAWKKKDVRDYTDVDVERLYDQWEDADEDELEEDELPEWKRKPPSIDMSQVDASNPESILKMSKKGKTLMMFATVSGDPTEKEAESITMLWHSSLFNANIDTQRYMVSSNRVIFMLKDGAKAWEVKDFLVQQDRCEEVTIEGQSYPGKGAPKEFGPEKKKEKGKKGKGKEEL